ncbi:MAG TPA: 30S ribosomal protein S12 methylthiotransferase RimO [Bacteroidales bacterium]|jgi:ribosomal protein S12 methylthiotransferase|nr:30S ribosomal protein S12 methylthiotransferase RimO [Bacteroidales bacterium]HNR42616.1 30S ribosomal protein S12 methylthiotransferase RimO [Bacteroidales bacterium]HPM17381.1 30S ribosomal protein S12 methylthiotransferase RimO [Bacteroidales bacterium]HQG78246.1 30S ribosomal protein S12 methylthiotransferase RimO [Bacteroidales bacterium]
MINRTINIVTLGCSKNLVDSEKLTRQIEAAGYRVIYDGAELSSNIVIVNTCGFINDAKEESIDTILRFVEALKKGDIEKLYVTGCLSERYAAELRSEIPEVSRYFGVNSMDQILRELGGHTDKRLLLERRISDPGHYAYLKVSEGCSRTCAFCAIPSIRGKYLSRPVEEVVEEARILARNEVKELILIAQDLSYYGLDLYRTQMLPVLLRELLGIESFRWIRLHYLYPSNFPTGIIPMMQENRRICQYIDIPVQHISDRILKMMKRSHNGSETRELLATLRKELPGAAIRTTLIAGHPGETQKEFSLLKDFVGEFRFDRLGVFPYSHEEGTYSYSNYRDSIPEKIKKERVSELMELQQSISSDLNTLKINKILKVIIDRREGDMYIGRTEHDSPDVDQEVLINAVHDLKPGNFYNILITRSTEFDLFGTPV